MVVISQITQQIILVVDEELAVGDAEFQKKAIGKMQDVSRGEGRTVLFVSHNMASVSRLCKSGIVLDRGKVIYSGSIKDTIEHYLNLDTDLTSIYKPISDKRTQVMSICIVNESSEVSSRFLSSQNIVVDVLIRNGEEKNIRGNFSVCNSIGIELFVDRFQVPVGEHLFRMMIPSYKLLSGTYKVNVALDSYGEAVYDVLTDVICFEISDLDSEYSVIGDIENGIVASFVNRDQIY